MSKVEEVVDDLDRIKPKNFPGNVMEDPMGINGDSVVIRLDRYYETCIENQMYVPASDEDYINIYFPDNPEEGRKLLEEEPEKFYEKCDLIEEKRAEENLRDALNLIRDYVNNKKFRYVSISFEGPYKEETLLWVDVDLKVNKEDLEKREDVEGELELIAEKFFECMRL